MISGPGVVELWGRKSPSPIDKAHGLYNSLYYRTSHDIEDNAASKLKFCCVSSGGYPNVLSKFSWHEIEMLSEGWSIDTWLFAIPSWCDGKCGESHSSESSFAISLSELETMSSSLKLQMDKLTKTK